METPIETQGREAAGDTAAGAVGAGRTAQDYDVFARTCPSRATLGHLTGRWGSLTLSALADGALRFNALQRRVDGISQKMLVQTLQALERDGFLRRHVQTAIPPHVEYSLTALGQDTAAKLADLIALLESRMPEVEAAQRQYDAAARGEASR